MSHTSDMPDLDDILDAFALEAERDENALAQYLDRYPQHAAALISLYRELVRVADEEDHPLTPEDEALAEASWAKLRDAISIPPADPFADRSPAQLREVARILAVPRQVVTAFRERRVVLKTVPRRFIERLAAALGAGTEAVLAALTAPPGVAVGRSYKADSQPVVIEQVSFEQILIDADVEPARISDLLAGRD